MKWRHDMRSYYSPESKHQRTEAVHNGAESLEETIYADMCKQEKTADITSHL